jgi:hypothetical protein
MNEPVKYLLVAGLFLAVGYYMGSAREGVGSGSGSVAPRTANVTGPFAFSQSERGNVLTDTRTGTIWLLDSKNPGSTGHLQPGDLFWSIVQPPK